MPEIKFSPAAITDLLEIKAYIIEESSDQLAANKTVGKILKRINALEDFPLSGPSLSSIVESKTDYRFLTCGHYKAFYRIENGIVYIIRILYGRRDFMTLLFKEREDD